MDSQALTTQIPLDPKNAPSIPLASDGRADVHGSNNVVCPQRPLVGCDGQHVLNGQHETGTTSPAPSSSTRQALPEALNGPHSVSMSPHMQEVPSNQNQTYCFMPVSSGMLHAPFVLQCVPMNSPMPTTSPVGQAGPGAHNDNLQTPTPGIVPSSSSRLASPPVGHPVTYEAASNGGLDSVASALTQLRASSFRTNYAPTFLSSAVAPELLFEKPRPHLCTMKDHWGHQCKRTFTRPYDLQRHQETVHGSARKTFSCEECGCKSKNFSRQDSLARHIRRMHRPVGPGEQRAAVAAQREEESKKASHTKAELAEKIEATVSPKKSHVQNADCKDSINDDEGDVGEPERKRMKIEHLLTAQMV